MNYIQKLSVEELREIQQGKRTVMDEESEKIIGDAIREELESRYAGVRRKYGGDMPHGGSMLPESRIKLAA